MNVIKLHQDLLSLVRREHDIRRMHGVIDDKFYLAGEKRHCLVYNTRVYLVFVGKDFFKPADFVKVDY